MKLYRYMSRKEFDLLKSGASLHNDLVGDDYYSDAHGFCFLAETTIFKTTNWDGELREYRYTPEECLEFLGGIVSEEVLVEFEVEDLTILHQGFGNYMNPISVMYDGTIWITEYSCHDYDRTVLRPLRVKFNNPVKYDWVKRPWIEISE